MRSNKKIILVGFGSTNLSKSIKRLDVQAKKSKFYDEIKIFSESDFDKEMMLLFKELMNRKKKRGSGFWIWKPYFLLEVFKKVNYGDIINYVDVGCHIISENKKRFNEYLDILCDEKVWLLPFQYKKDVTILKKDYEYPSREEYKFTKSDLLDYYGYLNKKEIIESPQYWAGSFFIKKTDQSLQFLTQWLDIFHKRFDLVDDTPSILKNHLDFVENRHDQSVFSILCKKNNIKSLSAYECDWAIYQNKRIWDHTKHSPILAKRDLQYNIFKRFLNRQKKNFRRIKSKFYE